MDPMPSPSEPVLLTARLRISLLDAADAPRVRAYYDRNRAHFGPWDPRRDDAFYTDEHWREQLARSREDAVAERAIRLFATPRDAPDGDVVGAISFTRIVRGPFQCVGLGYSLDLQSVGQGLMREALRAAIDWITRERGFHRVEANHRPENFRSSQLLTALGFVVEGYARDYLLIDGAWRDHVLTSFTVRAEGA